MFRTYAIISLYWFRVATLVLTLTSTTVWADQPRQLSEIVVDEMRFQPAQLRLSPEELGKRIGMPARAGDFSEHVLCHVVLDTRGNTRNIYCYNDEESSAKAPFVRAVLHVLSGSKYYPVRVNGARRSATIPLSVRFTQHGNEQSIKVMLNHGQYQVFYGDEYIAPQLYDLGANHHFGRSCGNLTNLKVQLHVGKRGDVYEVAYVGGEASATCMRLLQEELHQANATPLIFSGTAVASRMQIPFLRSIAVRN